jgi:2-polyprenyl-6-methoxyphenol hydroxylase-like FAD-dependent oxidoreductase
MASASEERRTLGFMCRNDYVTDRDAMIIGGKIAGPVTVMALQRTGVEATVSRRTPRGKRPRMLGSAPNGLDTLDAVGLDHAVRKRTRYRDAFQRQRVSRMERGLSAVRLMPTGIWRFRSSPPTLSAQCRRR